ncbi:MAG: polyprenyl synthetase family protein [Bacteroidales bacterium]|nr:polyprenyl synthetase family protein [Bacteroidales bacterium]MCL2739257.1 polyprenyl synthetase family protein [Bacteroidales bacterium]
MFSLKELHSRIEKGLASLPFDKEPQALYHPVAYSISVGGKRIRPTMCLLSHQLFSRHIDDYVLMPALGLELFHAFTLAHDDIMDGADIRRGQATLHRKWNTNTAILSGDVMCIYAYSLMAQSAPAVLPQVLESFSRTAAQVCEGQQYDMSYEGWDLITHEDYLHMIALKTAALIACSAQIGALCGGATALQAQHLYNFGQATGMGFQIRDDYLDAFGDLAVFGKSIGGDILNNKKTWLLVDALQKAEGAELKELNRLLNLQDAPQEKVAGVIHLYQKLGIPQAAEAEINRLHEASSQALEQVDVPDHKKEQLYQYVVSLLSREK